MGFWDRKKSGKILKMAVFSLFLLFFCTRICVYAAEKQDFSREEEALGELDLKEVEMAVDQLLEEKQSMRGMIRDILKSGQAFSSEQWKAVIQQGVWDAMGIQKETCVHILVLVLLSAVFCHLSGVFQNNQIGDISFYMIYLLLFLLLLQAFDEMTGQMERLLEGVAVFMKALLPAYYIALTGAMRCGNCDSILPDDSDSDFSHREDPVTFSSSGDPDVSGAGTDQFPYKRRILIKNDRTFKERNPLGIEIHDRRDRGNPADPAYDLTGG